MAQAAPAIHTHASDPGMKREQKVKLGWHKGTVELLGIMFTFIWGGGGNDHKIHEIAVEAKGNNNQ